MTETLTKDVVLQALRSVRTPGGADVVSQNLVSEIVIQDGKVYFSLEVPRSEVKAFEAVRKAAEVAVVALKGVKSALVTLTADTKGQRPGSKDGGGEVQSEKGIKSIRHIIAVASGKGGVGKSTTAVNLALGLSENGLKVGLLDADIYGPSVPRLLALRETPKIIGENTLEPLRAFGIMAMSMGFLVAEERPMIWRGPMVISALTQMLNDVAWGALDVLVVDMPPGTGDAQLTLAQKVPLSGAVIVSTPQDLALIDARKGLNMFKSVNVPVLGIVENMSFFVCPHCGGRSDIFSHGGAHKEADRLGVPFLGELPLTMEIRETSDGGRPIVVSDPASLPAQLYRNIAERIWRSLSGEAKMPTPPKIVIE